jgi:hypothetical protein
MAMDEIDLEFLEQEAEERLTQREASMLGLASPVDDFDMDPTPYRP